MANGKLISFIFSILIISLLVTGCSYDLESYPISGQAYVVSVSSDGNYVVTSNAGKKLILWDIKNKTEKIISTNANIYSAYFIKNTDMFMWQDLNDIVHIQNVYGKEILSFHTFPTYGQVITSDLKYYFASNENLDLYAGYGKNQHLILSNGNHGGFIGLEKLMNLMLSNDNQFLLTSEDGGAYQPLEFNNDGGVILWDVLKEKPIKRYIGNQSKTFATMSYDEKYIVSGDEGSGIFIWNTKTGKQLLLYSIAGIIKCKTFPDRTMQCTSDTTGFPVIPKDFINANGVKRDFLQSVKFLDLNNHYLSFPIATPYAILYQTTNSKPLKYLPLGKYPWPITRSMSDYSRDEAIDTAPAANILVMAQADGPGIIVYKFDPKTLTLNKIWAPGADFQHFIKMGLLSFLFSLLLCLLFNLKKYPTAEKVITGITLAMMLLSLFPLYAYGCSAILAGIIISIITSHLLNLPITPIKKIKLLHHS